MSGTHAFSVSHHPEPKSTGRDERPCGRATVGLLVRRPVRAAGVQYVGKEINRLDEVQAGLVHDEAEVLAEYRPLSRRLVCSGCGRPFDAISPCARACSERCKKRMQRSADGDGMASVR